MKKFNALCMFMLATVALPLMMACGDDDEEESFDTTPINIYSNGEKTISGADTITSANKFIAYTKGNKVTAFHVGKTDLTVNGKYKISLSVLPLYHLYDDPILEWGCSVDYVKSHQKQGTLNSKSTDELLAYENAGGASILGYSFENGKLKSVGAFVSTSHTSTLADYLMERYLMEPYYQGAETYYIGMDGLTTEEANTALIMNVASSSMIQVTYASAKQLASTRGESANNAHEGIKNKANELMRMLLEK